MDYITYLKKEMDKVLFIETKSDITLNIKGSPVLLGGINPVLSSDLVDNAKQGIDAIPASSIINAMAHVIACDKDFKYNSIYIAFLLSVDGIGDYLLCQIEKYKKSDIKKSLIYITALNVLFESPDYEMNRIYILMNLYDKKQTDLLYEEIKYSLENLTKKYQAYTPGHFELGKFYLDKDTFLAKIHIRQCLSDDRIKLKAHELLLKIDITEKYDNAVDLVKNGDGAAALTTLCLYIKENPDNPDAKYYAACAYRQSGYFNESLGLLNEILEYGELPEVYSEIALNFAGLLDFTSSLVYFKKAQKIKPSDAKVICNIGVCNLKLGLFDDAKSAFELSSRLDPKDETAKKWLEKMRER